jgi:hypothetical protein
VVSRRARRARLVPGLGHALRRQDPEGLWALLVAAGASPSVRERWASIGHLVNAVLRADARGRKPVVVDDLAALLSAAVVDESRLTMLEDFMPSDPREVVLVRFEDRLLRLFPGSIERPIADIDRWLLVAGAVDDVLLDRQGFGIRDLVGGVLDYVDWGIGQFAEVWPPSPETAEEELRLTESELAVAKAVVAAGTPDFVREGRRAAALDWATCEVAQLPYRADDPQSPFGRFVRVHRPADEDVRWLPLALLPEILGFAVNELAAAASQLPGASERFARHVAADIRRALWRFTAEVLGAPDQDVGPVVEPTNSIQWIAMHGPRRAVLVQVVAQLRPGPPPFANSVPAALQVVKAAAAAPTEPVRVPMPGGTITLDPGTEVVPLLVVATAGHVVAPQAPGMLGVSLDDLRWIATSADSDSDLYMFTRDMIRPDLPRYFGWEAINVWEWWRSNGKTFVAGGKAPTYVSVTPHWGVAEWQRAAEIVPIERALTTLGLPGTREFDVVEAVDSGAPAVYRWGGPTETVGDLARDGRSNEVRP